MYLGFLTSAKAEELNKNAIKKDKINNFAKSNVFPILPNPFSLKNYSFLEPTQKKELTISIKHLENTAYIKTPHVKIHGKEKKCNTIMENFPYTPQKK